MGDDAELLLWPSNLERAASASSSQAQAPQPTVAGASKVSPAAAGLFDDTLRESADLLWPAALINQQARMQKQHNYTLPLAIIAFVFSCLLGLAIGPLQLIMIAATNNYNWVTTIFYNSTLNVVLPTASVIAALAIAALVMLWLRPTLKQRTIIALAIGSLAELGIIWWFGYVQILPPPQLMLILIATAVIGFLAILFINKQYVATPDLSPIAKVVTIIVGLIAAVEMIAGVVYLFGRTNSDDDSELAHLTVLQMEARVEDVPEVLSDLVFTVCNQQRYQVIYLSENQTIENNDADNNAEPNNNLTNTAAGLFECTGSGEVYSVAQSDVALKDTVTGSATYLGTTKDKAITLAFPNTYYLYRSLPDVLSEDELAIMFPATSEQELIDNLTPMLLSYWQNHSDHNLYLNAFYNSDLSQIHGTGDYILMSALGTMVMVEGLPHGINMRGVANGEFTNYLFHADTELAALNEFGALPDRYAISTREALMTKRHISIHLAANEPLDYDGLAARLWEAFTGGVE